MEGYRNVTGSPDGFDDGFDIEGRSVVDEWNGKNDSTYNAAVSRSWVAIILSLIHI